MLDSISPCVHRTAGIDLGTTNSVIAQLDPSGRMLLTGRDDQGRSTVPSVVGWDEKCQQVVAGRDALALMDPPGERPSLSLPLSSIKRFMGLDRRFPVGPRSLTPVEVSAVILRQLREHLTGTLADPRQVIDRAIITMPAYFNHNQIEATRHAAELAGYDVVELLHEPTAAAIFYSWIERHADATYLVYDLGGGTFDVSIIRRRLGDYEVLAVLGDPFLGGDDFDRLLATHLLEAGTWRWGSERARPAALFDPTSPEGAVSFARLVRISEAIKVELTSSDRVERYVPRVLQEKGCDLTLEATVTRATFNRLIKDKIDRTIDCCHEALALAKQKANVRLADVDYVILVGGSSRLPLVREMVQAAFCSHERPEHVRCPEPLLHEPDLCVAYGAALRAAEHGTRYQFPFMDKETRRQGDKETEKALELHITSPASTRETNYQAAGLVRILGSSAPCLPVSLSPCLLTDGASVRIRSLDTGLVDEAFLDRQGAFAHDLELLAEADNALEWTVCDADGRERARVVTNVRHEGNGRPLGQGVLPTQLIVKPLSIEVLGRGRQRVKQVVAPVGAALPGTFRCVCRTSDQSGRVVVPICEENRVVKQLVIEDLDSDLPVGSPVEVDLTIDCKHAIEVRVRVRGGGDKGDRCETALLEPPPPPARPSRGDVEEIERDLQHVLEHLTGRHRARVKTRAAQLRQDLLEALSYDDEAKAIQRLAELRDLLAQAERAREQALEPPWPRFAALVRDCLDLAAEVARRTGRDSEDLFAHVHAQDRYAEQAHEEHNQALYRECWDNLEKYAGYLSRLLHESRTPPGAQPSRSPQEEARAEVDQFRNFLSSVWKQARARGRTDLEGRLADLARQASGLSQRLKTDPVAALRDARRLGVEVEKVHAQLEQPSRSSPPDDAGLLEGSP
jgi:molecular chaperone DnaK